MSSPRWLLPVLVSPGVVPVAFFFSRRLSRTSKWVFLGSFQSTASVLALMARYLLCIFKHRVYVSYSAAALLGSGPTVFTARCSGSLSSQCRTPRLGNSVWCSDLSLFGKSLCDCDDLSVCELSTRACWRRKWQPTQVLLPGKSHGWRSLVGCSPWGRKSWTRLSDFTFTFHFHALEKEMGTHSSVLAWRIPEGPGGLPSMGLHRAGHD